MSGKSYASLLEKLCGRGVYLEVGDPSRPSPEVIKGMLWATLCQQEVALVIVFQDENTPRIVKAPLPPPNQPLAIETGVQYDTFREFYFKWVRIENILTVQSDVNARMDIRKRAMVGPKPDPLYRDNDPGWSTLNNALVDRIQSQLAEMGFYGVETPANLRRTDANDPVPLEPVPVPVPVTAPVVDVVAVPAAGA